MQREYNQQNVSMLERKKRKIAAHIDNSITSNLPNIVISNHTKEREKRKGRTKIMGIQIPRNVMLQKSDLHNRSVSLMTLPQFAQ